MSTIRWIQTGVGPRGALYGDQARVDASTSRAPDFLGWRVRGSGREHFSVQF